MKNRFDLNDEKVLDSNIKVEFKLKDFLLLHAASAFMDGRHALTKLIRRNITPRAIAILKASNKR